MALDRRTPEEILQPHEPARAPAVVSLTFTRVAHRIIIGAADPGVEIIDRMDPARPMIGALNTREAARWLGENGYQMWPCLDAPGGATWVRPQ